ncbi:hypothetical protein BJ912DRAFT_475802 [Pholiota molesta]|nr:hypothetical protein BJ912DRAFT_475802 [Pholiota molesta]
MQDSRRKGGGSAARRDETGREAEEARGKMRNRRSLRLSIDKFSDLVDREGAPAVPPLVRGKSAVGVAGAPRVKEKEVGSDGDTECEREETKKPAKAKKEQEKEKEKEKSTASPSGSGASGGNRFWKLMRRISVGGLKEKYRDASLPPPPPPPPVPALPKDIHYTLPALQASRSNDSSLKRHAVDAKKTKSASSSPTAADVPVPQKIVPPPALVPQAKAPAAAPAVTPAVASTSQPRPSTTTRSSSPVSSDVASSKFFHRTHSARSSTSSFEEEHPPPLPKKSTMVLRHIVPPSELAKTHGHDEEAASTSQRARAVPGSTHRVPRPDDDWEIVRSPSVELQSLPLPPRRLPPLPATEAAATASDTPGEIERAESPTIPSFSTSAAVNAFPARRLSSTFSARSRASPNSPHASSPSSRLPSPSSVVSPQSATALPPPPRPLRSAQRPVTMAGRPPIIAEPRAPASASIPIPAGRKSESHIRNASSPQPPPLAHSRRSSGGLSGASSSTATARRRSSFGGGTAASSVRSLSVSLATPPPGAEGFTFREMESDAGGRGARPALSEREKAARWEDLLERSARAGGTLHLAGGARVLASDR